MEVSYESRLREIEAIAIGASSGAVAALSRLLPVLPAGYRLPVCIVVHVPPQGPTNLAGLFQSMSRVIVKEAEDKEPLVGGTVYFAPPDYHLLVEKNRSLSLSRDEPVSFARPSVDVLFETAADAFGPALLAIVLTGANHDGARGLAAVASKGGMAVVQLPASAESRTMPEAALAACKDAIVLEVHDIAELLRQSEGRPI